MKPATFHMVGGNPTRSDTENLCITCHRSQIMKGPSESQELTWCNSLARPVPFQITVCSNYSDKRLPSLWDMKETAWILSTKKVGRAIGFVSPKEWRDKNPNADPTPGHD